MSTPSWMSGYVGDVSYTLGFYREMAPAYLHYISVINSFSGVARRPGMRYCELGCGRGYGTAVLAAANPDATFVGIDFNPSHIGEARAFAAAAGLENVTFQESDFAEAARSTDPQLEAFDVVTMHGVYSWVSQAVRESVHDFLRAKVAPGGIVYVSYNTQPGWSASAPIQRLLREVADRTTGDSLMQVAAGKEALKTLVEKSSAFTVLNPGAKRRIESLENESPQYTAHEYLNKFWEPLYVSDVFAMLAEAKLTFAGSAVVADNRLGLCVPTELIPLVESAGDVALRELLKDFAINKPFRRDVYVRGPTRVSGSDADRLYEEIGFALLAPPSSFPDVWRVPVGTAKADNRSFNSVAALLSEGPASAQSLRDSLAAKDISASDLGSILEILIHNGVVLPCRTDFAQADGRQARRLNAAVFDASLRHDSHRYLASPVLGSGVQVSYFERLAAPVVLENEGADDNRIVELLFDRFDSTGRGIMRDGKPLERNDESQAELAGMVARFRAVSLPIWRQLGIVE